MRSPEACWQMLNSTGYKEGTFLVQVYKQGIV